MGNPPFPLIPPLLGTGVAFPFLQIFQLSVPAQWPESFLIKYKNLKQIITHSILEQSGMRHLCFSDPIKAQVRNMKHFL